jgi:hypothetical protein
MPFDVSGAIDMHGHCGPEGYSAPISRATDGSACLQQGLRSIVMKSHFTDTSRGRKWPNRETGMRLGGSVTSNAFRCSTRP